MASKDISGPPFGKAEKNRHETASLEGFKRRQTVTLMKPYEVYWEVQDT